MKDCVRFAPMIGAREGELSPADDAALSAHLEACPACRALAADFAATEGLVSEALMAQANARDFAPFVDAVMARVEEKRTASQSNPAHAEPLGRARDELRGANGAAESRHGPSTAPGPRPGYARGERWNVWAWLGAHRRAAFGTLAPVLAAAALLVYVRLDDGGRSQIASLELASEGEVTMILQTSDGPVVLLAGEES
jgi:anti-sigma factor RsiW